MKNKKICPFCKEEVKKDIKELNIKNNERTLEEWLKFFRDKREYGFRDNFGMIHNYCNIKHLLKFERSKND